MIINSTQKKIFELLIKKYEKSKTYKGENKTNQNFSISPCDIWKDYSSDFVDADKKRDFADSILRLAEKGLIEISKKRYFDDIEKIIAIKEKYPEYYKLAGITELKEIQEKELMFYESYLGKHPIVDAFCKEEIEKINKSKKPEYSMEVAQNIMHIILFLYENEKELMEREFSQIVLHNTKTFSDQYKSKVCKILRRYGKLEFEEENQLLEIFHVYQVPQFIYFKGNFTLKFKDGSIVESKYPFSIMTDTLKEIKEVIVNNKRVVTIENLTSFYRFEEKDTFVIYLAGYHNKIREDFLSLIYECNPMLEWYHFGDLDPDGFYILENLKNKTGIPFKPLYMDLETLKKHSEFQKLKKFNILKAKSLIEKGLYVEVLTYILEHDCKLEQEIVSLGLEKEAL